MTNGKDIVYTIKEEDKEVVMENKKKLRRSNLIFGIVFVIMALVAFFGEIFSFTAYIDTLEGTESLEGFGIIVIIIFGLIAAIALLVCAILNFVAAGVLSSNKNSGRGMAIVGAIFKFIAACILILYCALMFTYPMGYALKVLYALVAVASIYFGILDLTASGKLKDSE